MIKMSVERSLGAIIVLFLVLVSPSAADQLSQESFEGLTGYTISNPFDDGSFDFFDRYAVPDNSNPARDDFQMGWHLDFGLMGQDFDGQGGSPMELVTIAAVNITGFSNLGLTVSFGALDDEAGGFDNYEAADGDGIRIFANIDGGGAVQIGQFSPPAVGANTGDAAGDLYRDDNFDGIGTGARLTRTLTDFLFPIAGLGSSVEISFELTSTGSFEMLAMDNVRVTSVPEPNCVALIALGILGWGFQRKRK